MNLTLIFHGAWNESTGMAFPGKSIGNIPSNDLRTFGASPNPNRAKARKMSNTVQAVMLINRRNRLVQSS
ncbi:hypothetical protein AB4142_04890 [Variovorax sp. 2RAF20]